ncbi:hypothetical protein D3C71_1816540 [compost metagenome]
MDWFSIKATRKASTVCRGTNIRANTNTFRIDTQNSCFCSVRTQLSNPIQRGGLNRSHSVKEIYVENMTGNNRNTTTLRTKGRVNTYPQIPCLCIAKPAFLLPPEVRLTMLLPHPGA